MNSDTLKELYNKKLETLNQRISSLVANSALDLHQASLEEVKELATTIVDIETAELNKDVAKLLEQKEAIDRELEKKSEALQDAKYNVFNTLESELTSNPAFVLKLHQVKLQSIDLYDILSEMVESAIISALEKDSDGDISETIIEVIKEITFESIKEGSLNTIRVRKILSTILITAIDISEATPNRADDILRATLKGMRSGLVRSIDRFKKRLTFMPMEAKHILIEDYDTIMEDLSQTDTLFSQVIAIQAAHNTAQINTILLQINKDMSYDLEELVHISKETAEVMRKRFASFAKNAVKKADMAMKSPRAKEAKRMGIQALGVAKVALGTAIKSAKDAIDTKDK
ncbi:hypothetical protein [Sulfurimonas sp.]|jgi:vacuolar-type H+-ATPase subunit I/STV1|uniref:hypothetical protein n=1 Tax=Sulfurimonas sp. TaxID=2022749 RepID=UPI0025F9F3CC|nr:hypothetical protein [Sulfurimonas sp.]MBT5935357.1 hypothetical protein [Sulfurimonas sp.]